MRSNMIPPTTVRVPVNDQGLQKLEQKVGECVQATGPSIDRTLEHLDHEWDIERFYETTIGVISLVGLAMGVWVNQWWLALSAFGAVSLLTHALFGWSVLLFLFRALGVRTATEIAYERYALKALRGDFHRLGAVVTPEVREAISTFEGEGGMVYGPPVSEACDPKIVKEAVEAVQR